MIFRWLGVAGIELRVDRETLVIDPYFTRAPLRNVFYGRVIPDVQNRRLHHPSYNYILITHPHFDHVMDAGELLKQCGAQGYGSPNACRLMGVMGAPRESLNVISPGDHLDLGPFSVDVYPLDHRSTPIDRWINGALARNLKAPLRLLDYRMDVCYGFHIQVDRFRVLVGDLTTEADVLFTIPMMSRDYYEQLLNSIRPRLIVLIHWDDFFRPLSKQILPMFAQPKLIWPPFQRLNMVDIQREIESISRDFHVLVPKIFYTYELKNEKGWDGID